jgi:hypothetical protein
MTENEIKEAAKRIYGDDAGKGDSWAYYAFIAGAKLAQEKYEEEISELKKVNESIVRANVEAIKSELVAELKKDLDSLSWKYMNETASPGREFWCKEIRKKHGLGNGD